MFIALIGIAGLSYVIFFDENTDQQTEVQVVNEIESTTTTSIDSTNLSVEDIILTINQNASAETDSWIMINRGSAQDPAVFFWDETEDKFKKWMSNQQTFAQFIQ